MVIAVIGDFRLLFIIIELCFFLAHAVAVIVVTVMNRLHQNRQAVFFFIPCQAKQPVPGIITVGLFDLFAVFLAFMFDQLYPIANRVITVLMIIFDLCLLSLCFLLLLFPYQAIKRVIAVFHRYT